MAVMGQSDIENTKENVLAVCDQTYHTNKRQVQNREDIEILQNVALA